MPEQKEGRRWWGVPICAGCGGILGLRGLGCGCSCDPAHAKTGRTIEVMPVSEAQEQIEAAEKERDELQRARDACERQFQEKCDELLRAEERAEAAGKERDLLTWRTNDARPDGEGTGPDFAPCDECGRPVLIAWFASNDLWNLVNG